MNSLDLEELDERIRHVQVSIAALRKEVSRLTDKCYCPPPGKAIPNPAQRKVLFSTYTRCDGLEGFLRTVVSGIEWEQ